MVNYRYLSDGTKLSCLDSQGEGYEYLGSLVYERKGGHLRLESTPFSGGRFVAAQTDSRRMLALHHISDHLGSTRVVVDSCGMVRERNDYYAFGKRWDDPDRPVSDNRYLFNGKEAQIIGATGWLDYGARMYDPELGRWFVPDPLAEVYYGTSLYAYVRNNPIMHADPDGMRIWPVNETYNGCSRRHENNYGASRPKGRAHSGVDINLGSGNDDLGAPIYATHDGLVTSVTRYDEGRNAGGNRVKITANDGTVSTFYMHLNSINSDIKPNVPISEGQQIGTMGGSGYGREDAFNSHLHYEMFVNGSRIDPTDGSKSLIDPMKFIIPEINIAIPEITILGESKFQRPRINFPNKHLDINQDELEEMFDSNF